MSHAFYKYIIDNTVKLDVYVDFETTRLLGFGEMYSATCDIDLLAAAISSRLRDLPNRVESKQRLE